MHGDPGRSTHDPLDIAQRDVDADTGSSQRVDRAGDGQDDRVDSVARIVGERVRGVDRVVGVEGDCKKGCAVTPCGVVEATHELPPEDDSDRVQPGTAVPRLEHVCGMPQVDHDSVDQDLAGRPTALHHGLAQQFGRQAGVVEHGGEHVVDRDATAPCQVSGQAEVLAGSQAPCGPFEAAQHGIALEHPFRVRQPVRVVRVDHDVASEHLR